MAQQRRGGRRVVRSTSSPQTTSNTSITKTLIYYVGSFLNVVSLTTSGYWY